MEAPTSNRELTAARSAASSTRKSRIRFVGALDAFTVRAALARIDSVIESDVREVIVDLAELVHIDSYGVRALSTLHKRVTAQGGKVLVVNCSDQPRMVLELCGLRAALGL